MIQEFAMRGTRIGGRSYERDDMVEPAERQIIRYECPAGHVTRVPFFSEAEEIPLSYGCKCGQEATLAQKVANLAQPEQRVERHVRTHWDMLLERRSIADLEILLAERVQEVRGEAAASLARTA